MYTIPNNFGLQVRDAVAGGDAWTVQLRVVKVRSIAFFFIIPNYSHGLVCLAGGSFWPKFSQTGLLGLMLCQVVRA